MPVIMSVSGRQTKQRVCKIDANPESDNRWGYTGDCVDDVVMPNLNFADQAIDSDREYFGMFIKGYNKVPLGW